MTAVASPPAADSVLPVPLTRFGGRAARAARPA
jgi:hypothetical protein